MALISRASAQEQTVAYLGPQGTYSEEIALGLYRGVSGRFIPYASIFAAIRAVEDREVAECVVPLENSLEGAVNSTMDSLAGAAELFITKDIIVPIRHNLMAGPETKHINVIVSHAQALAQCRNYLAQHYPGAELKAVDSTAAAAYLVASGKPNYAAIGSQQAGKIYGLEIIETDIQDHPHNYTRFVVLSRQAVQQVTGYWKKTIICQIDGEQPGSLCAVLEEFAKCGVNLTRIESRPARTGLGNYLFFLDMEGCAGPEMVHKAIAAVKLKSRWYKDLGSYPVYQRSGITVERYKNEEAEAGQNDYCNESPGDQ